MKRLRVTGQPRHPAGSPQGGQFAAAPGGAGWRGGYHSRKDIGSRSGPAGQTPGAPSGLRRSDSILGDSFGKDSDYRLDINDDATVRKVFGRIPKATEFARMMGATPGAKLAVVPHYEEPGTVIVVADHPKYVMERRFSRDGKGLRVQNYSMELTDEGKEASKQGAKLGTRLFARQVVEAPQMGVTSISTYAAGSRNDANYNGYHTWARLGYSRTLYEDDVSRLEYRASSRFGYSDPAYIEVERRSSGKQQMSIHELFDMPGGADLWRYAGDGGNMTFDPRPGSANHSRLMRYVYDNNIDLEDNSAFES